MAPDSATPNRQVLVRPALYVVATPIGNLADVTERARQVLAQVDLIAAEDTRHSARLLQHLGVTTRMIAYHDFSTGQQEQALLTRLQQGNAIALISDAGTPLISDPGYGLVRQCRQSGVPVIPVPGASALVSALSVAGLPSDRFIFEGFLPAKAGARQSCLKALADEVRTLVFYESPHRILASIDDMAAVFGGQREAVICRELTKTWETVYGDSLAGIQQWLRNDDNQQRGEFVVLVHGAPKTAGQDIDPADEHVLQLLLRELPMKQACSLAADITGRKKNQLYKRALELAVVQDS
ncbi:16S rRNA (cytidine(1402)-2'-O)-methyltransferase [Pseudohongiella spirulinae]|uniref:Ribosomal RNA small subunit methyltransferase I n=1 Tax=Pseudohongiella spirulinae TaxID=1249552 RepID=A0A0S2KG54_9GAMM|nr:16S rRNA (cytidine(1402)-2'-O)-methyltransferase [Pseudohongiella spirulinae]ALO46943.1 Ribosomal RNA small subunit methyltransferase I [Pseudohongiella spirulinae]